MAVSKLCWYTVFLNVKKVVFRTKSSSAMMSSISTLVLSVKVVLLCSLVLIISIILSIRVLVKRDTISWDIKMASSCRVTDFSSSARCLEFLTWFYVSPTLGPRRSARIRDSPLSV